MKAHITKEPADKRRTGKMTNFEKIKQMSVEDMALMLMCPAEYDTDFNKKSKCKGSFSNCYNCTLHWLESEAEE